ncbi:MAG: type IX secretion system protein PorQ [Saprospiraceae bacterium]|nr:type IX secretion system protein PorQ [Saprospiraceae bacterium]
MKQFLLPVLLGFILSGSAGAQLGGNHVFSFLNLSPSARVSALGGNLITVRDDDVNLSFLNPGLLNPRMHQQISFNHNFHFSNVQHGYASYGQYVPRLNTTFHLGLQYVNYGEFDATDVFGQVNGTFKAAEYAIVAGGGYQVDERLALGANLKVISSQLESYNSLGIATDLSAVYFDTASQVTATLVFRNIGVQLSTYEDDGQREDLPFEIQVGISKRLRHLPFRFSIIYHNMQRWNLVYDDPTTEENAFLFGDQLEPSTGMGIDNFFRHVIINGEFLFGKLENFRLRFGYNHFMRKELSVDSFGSLAGFSFGGGIKINRFRIDYGRTIFHLAGGISHIGISTNFAEFK